MGVLSLFIGIVRLFLSHTFFICEFEKNANSALDENKYVTLFFHVKLVWRLSEFAFLCVYFGRRTFLFYFIFLIFQGGHYEKNPVGAMFDFGDLLHDCLW